MGPLDGVRVIDIASLAPAPFGCMILSDLGGRCGAREVARGLRARRARTGRPADPRPAVDRVQPEGRGWR